MHLHRHGDVRYHVHAVNKTFSATAARKQFFKVLDLAEAPGFSVTITREGRPPLIIMSQEEFEGWQETMEIMSDPQLVKDIREGMADTETITLEELEAEMHATRNVHRHSQKEGRKAAQKTSKR